MARVSKSSLVVSDKTRVPVPGITPKTRFHARYVVTPLGHVYRDSCTRFPDGLLLTPTPAGKINFNGGSVSRSLTTLVFRAFGRADLIEKWRPEQRDVLIDGVIYDLWVDPCGPTDKLTGRRRCTVNDIKLVPHGELIIYGRRGEYPKTLLPII